MRSVVLIGLCLCLGLGLLVTDGGCERAEESADRSSNPSSGSADAQGQDQGAAKPQALALADPQRLNQLVSEAAKRDRIVVVDFWATWCVPCREMFPELHAGLEKMGQSVRPVTITLDEQARVSRAIDFLAKHHALTDAFAMDLQAQEDFAGAFGGQTDWSPLAVPAFLIFDAEGNVARRLGPLDNLSAKGVLAATREVVNQGEAGQ